MGLVQRESSDPKKGHNTTARSKEECFMNYNLNKLKRVKSKEGSFSQTTLTSPGERSRAGRTNPHHVVLFLAARHALTVGEGVSSACRSPS